MEAWSLAVMRRSGVRGVGHERESRRTSGRAVSGDVQVDEGTFVVLYTSVLVFRTRQFR